MAEYPTPPRLLTNSLRLTHDFREAVFEEEPMDGGYLLRRLESQRDGSLLQNGAEKVPRPIGTSKNEAKIEIEKITFKYNYFDNQWNFFGRHYRITLDSSCDIRDAERWLHALTAIEPESRGFLLTAAPRQMIGFAPKPEAQRGIAYVDKRTVLWFNHSNGRLLACQGTDTMPAEAGSVPLGRLVQRQSALLCGLGAWRWNQSLASSLLGIPAERLDAIGCGINPGYFPQCIQKWRDSESIDKSTHLVSDLLTELLLHLAAGGDWKTGLWPEMDAVVEDVRRRQSSEVVDIYEPQKERILYVPKTIEVSPELAAKIEACEKLKQGEIKPTQPTAIIGKGDWVRVTKLAACVDALFPSAKKDSYLHGEENLVSPPIDYSLEGRLLSAVEVGQEIRVERRIRNGIEVDGLFRSTAVKSVSDDLGRLTVTTQNSIYVIEQIPISF